MGHPTKLHEAKSLSQRWFLALSFTYLPFPALAADPYTLHGYVTAVVSDTEFAIDDMRVRCTADTTSGTQEGKVIRVRSFTPGLIRLGAEVEVIGTFDKPASELTAAKVILLSQKVQTGDVEGTALIERAPMVQKTNAGWEGTIWADGRTLQVTPATKVELADTISLNTFITYSGKLGANETVAVERASFQRNSTDAKEAAMREHGEPTITPPNYAEHKPGILKMRSYGTAGIVADEYLQQRVSEIGMELVPAFQKSLPENDPTKINFRFYVLKTKKPGILAASNGVVLVPEPLLAALKNEAQLASVLAIAVASIVQEHEYRQKHYRQMLQGVGWTTLAAGVALPGAGLAGMMATNHGWQQYQGQFYQQAGRLSLEYMIAGGWDIREAPQATRLLAKRRRGAARSSDEVPAFDRYLFFQLRNKYADLDYARLRKNQQDYNKLVH